MDISENITIKLNGHIFSLSHTHSKGEDIYMVKTIKGLKNAVGNILHGFQPDPYDLYRKDDEECISKVMRKEPKPITA